MIYGTGFVAGAKVTIGTPAESVHVFSSTEISAVTAPNAAGSDEVIVSDAGGTSSGGPSFQYTAPPPQPPTVPPVQPDTGPAEGGTEVTIKGTGFLPGAGVVIGGVAEAVQVIPPTEMRATTPGTAPAAMK